MAARTQPAETAPAPDADETVTAMARILARMVIAQSVSVGAATFAQIAVRELKVATDAEAATIQRWLSAHPPASS